MVAVQYPFISDEIRLEPDEKPVEVAINATQNSKFSLKIWDPTLR